MRIQQEQVGAVQILRPCGAIVGDDAATFARRLRSTVRSARGRVVLDLGGSPYTDSRGLEALVDAADELEAVGLALPICNANDTWREVLDLTEIAGRFATYVDRVSAVRSFSA